MTTEVQEKQLPLDFEISLPIPPPGDSVVISQPEPPAEGTGRQYRDHWDDTSQVFFTGNHGWGVAPDLSTVCLGTEFEIHAYLKGGTLPKRISQVAIEVLGEIRELKAKEDLENGRTRDVKVKSSRTQRAIPTSGVRVRPTSHIEYKPLNTRHLKARKRISGSKA